MSLLELIYAVFILAVAGGTSITAWYVDTHLIQAASAQRAVEDCADLVAEQASSSKRGSRLDTVGCNVALTVQDNVYGIQIHVSHGAAVQDLVLLGPELGTSVIHAVYGDDAV